MGIIIYIIIIFGLANLFYFLFSDGKKVKQKFWLTVSVLSIILLVVGIFLSLISSDSIITNTKDFLIFTISSIILTIIILLYHLELHKILNAFFTFPKSYFRYTFIFSLFSFFLNFIFFIILFMILSVIFDTE